MLALVAPERLDEVRDVCARWGLAAAVLGRLVAGGGLRVTMGGEVVADVPARSLADEAPEYERPMAPPSAGGDAVSDDPTFATPPGSAQDALFAVLASPNVASKRWVWEQYDWIVQGGTVRGPGSDAAIVRIEGGLKALAISSDGKGRFGALDPYLGAAHAVAESARNVAATGATPLAVTNCLNFGNPERPEVMWEFAESIRGMADACRAFGTPVTGGNVSFYNESAGSAIWPTPVIGMVGLLEDHRLALPSGFARGGDLVYVLGETAPELGGSEYADVVLGRIGGRPPALDLERERALHRLLVEGARLDILASAHDCGDGGLGVALAEAAIARSIGFAVTMPGDLPPHVAMFSESASRAVVSVDPRRAIRLEELAAVLEVPCLRVGETGGPRVLIDRILDSSVDELAAVYEGAIPALLAG
jgi:phosphoribosylformylglycinamidine synthase